MRCFTATLLGVSALPLIPIPVFGEASPHESIGQHQFSLIRSQQKTDPAEMPPTIVEVEISDKLHSFQLTRMVEPSNIFSIAYDYESDLRCNQVVDSLLRIYLQPDIVREYSVHFEEGVIRDIDNHLGLAT